MGAASAIGRALGGASVDVAGGGPDLLLFCDRRGSFAAAKSELLSRVCRMRLASVGSGTRLRRILGGCHPTLGVAIFAPWPLGHAPTTAFGEDGVTLLGDEACKAGSLLASDAPG